MAKEMKTTYFIIIILMVAIAYFFPWWKGIYLTEGFLAGVGFALAKKIEEGKKK